MSGNQSYRVGTSEKHGANAPSVMFDVRATHAIRTPELPSRARHSLMTVDRTRTAAHPVPATSLPSPESKAERYDSQHV